MPRYGLRDGAVVTRFGLAELPLSGMVSQPLNVLDTWSCFQAPNRRLGPEDYHREGLALLEHLRRRGCGLLNIYADPIHIYHQEAFFKTLRAWTAVAAPITYASLLMKLNNGSPD